MRSLVLLVFLLVGCAVNKPVTVKPTIIKVVEKEMYGEKCLYTLDDDGDQWIVKSSCHRWRLNEEIKEKE